MTYILFILATVYGEAVHTNKVEGFATMHECQTAGKVITDAGSKVPRTILETYCIPFPKEVK